jgi:ribonuclease-3
VKLFQRLGIHSLFFSTKDKQLATSIQLILGSKPFNLSLYRLALTPAGLGEETDKGFRKSNERLEFLGDAILGAVIAEYLFKKYPYRDEGFLTETRSKLVNRETLNEVGIKIGLKKTLKQVVDNRQFVGNKSLYGDILEAFLGAIYLDRGYAFTKKLILQRILIHMDLEGMITTVSNHKSKLIEWYKRSYVCCISVTSKKCHVFPPLQGCRYVVTAIIETIQMSLKALVTLCLKQVS